MSSPADAIQSYLESLGAAAWQRRFNWLRGFQGLPNVAAALDGKLIAVFIVPPGRVLTDDQLFQLNRLRSTGATCVAAAAVSDVRLALEHMKEQA